MVSALTILISLLLIVVTLLAYMGTSFRFISYRIGTIIHATKILWNLSPSAVDNFLNSYSLFNQDGVTTNTETKIVDYYSVLNWLCALGEVEKMYIPPILDSSVGTIGNQLLFEEKMAKDLGISAGQRVLDVGCGRGRIAAHIASITGAHVTGINIDQTQIENAKENAKNIGQENQLAFRQASFNSPLPFQDEEFDAIYEVQAFTYLIDKEKAFSEIFRILRPGGKFSILDWLVLDAYDPKNPSHVEIMGQVKPLLAAVWNPTVGEFCELLENAGFEIVLSENPSHGGVQYPLLQPVDRYFQIVKKVVRMLVSLRIFPKHFDVLLSRFTKGAEAFIEGDRKKLYTTCYQIVARKPKVNGVVVN